MRFGPNMLGDIDLKRRDHLRNPYSPGFAKSTVPKGRSGDWAVTRFTVEDKDVSLFNLRLIRDGQLRRVVPPGTYTRLVGPEGVVMTDTPAESHEHASALCAAKGSVLINGLGLGFYLQAVLSKKEVTQVTVIEKSPDVIKLVGPSFKDPRLTIIRADAYGWEPPKGTHYDFAWHDIWANICDNNKAGMTKLRRKYARRAAAQRCWSQEYLT